MKKIEFFGFQFSFDFNKKNSDDPEIYSSEDIFREKIFYLIILFAIFSLSSNLIGFYKNENYKVGDIIKTDIYAPKTVIYKDEIAKNKVIEQMILSSGKEYFFVSSAEKIYLENFEEFFSGVLADKTKKESFELKKYEQNNNMKINPEIFEQLIKMNSTKIIRIEQKLKELLIRIYKVGIFKEENKIELGEDLSQVVNELQPLEKKIIMSFIFPNYLYDKEKTENSIKEKVSQIKDQLVTVEAGALVGKKGSILTEQNIKTFEKLGVYSIKKNIVILFLNVLYVSLISFVLYLIVYNSMKKNILNKNYYRAAFLIILLMLIIFKIFSGEYLYLIPFDFLMFMLIILTNMDFSFIFSFFTLAFVFPMVDFNIKFFIMNIFSIIFGGYLIKKVRNRSEVINTGIKLSIIKVILFLILTTVLEDETTGVTLKSIEILTSGVLSGMFTLALIPYFEKSFNLITIFKLLELGDLSNPLLKRLSVEAPGTFHHSTMVAILSENAAESIMANTIFCRVASYYHDIGKLKRPHFYVENQSNGENPHNNISPFLSNTIIKAHTKDGVEIAKRYQIPKEIRDIMQEHQGTTLLAYFYNKAKQIDKDINVEDFMYLGPKPKSKESAIIMLADSIEAAVRSIDDKNYTTIDGMVRKIITSKIEANQLSEANLTFREIEVIIKSFVKTLISIHHVRMKYPGQK
ncbi:MAG: HD family phosphohydrolase [Fusobacteriaceae bacterium]